jgi:hypothetical protein
MLTTVHNSLGFKLGFVQGFAEGPLGIAAVTFIFVVFVWAWRLR